MIECVDGEVPWLEVSAQMASWRNQVRFSFPFEKLDEGMTRFAEQVKEADRLARIP